MKPTLATVFIAVLILTQGCHTINKTPRIEDVLINIERQPKVVKGSKKFNVAIKTDAGQIAGTARKKETCSVKVTRWVDRTVHVDKTTPWPDTVFYLGSGVAIPAGITSFAIGASNDDKSTAGYTLGTIFTSLGLSALIQGILITLDMAPEKMHKGRTAVSLPTESEICKAGPAAGTPASLTMETGFSTNSKVQPDGQFVIPMPPFKEILSAPRKSRVEIAVGPWKKTLPLNKLPGVAKALASHDAQKEWVAQQKANAARAAQIGKGQALWLGMPVPGSGVPKQLVSLGNQGASQLLWQGSQSLFTTKDGGANWTAVTQGLPSKYQVVDIVAHETTGKAWVLLLSGEVYELNSADAKWRITGRPVKASHLGIQLRLGGHRDANYLAVMHSAGIHAWPTQGGKWTAISLPQKNSVLELRYVNGTGWFALFENGSVHVSKDLKNWSELGTAARLPYPVRKAWLTAGTHHWLFAQTVDGRLLRRMVNEEKWQTLQMMAAGHAATKGLLTNDKHPTDIYVLTDMGVFRSVDAGDRFMPVNKGLFDGGAQSPGWFGRLGNDLYLTTPGTKALFYLGTVKERISLNASVLFDFGKHTLKDDAQQTLQRLAERLRARPVRIRIDGHTDNTGPEDHNKELSEQRAASVAKFFEQAQIPRFRLTTMGFGEDRPIATNDTKEGRQRNRRVEILVIGH